jgi:hypothetical protein
MTKLKHPWAIHACAAHNKSNCTTCGIGYPKYIDPNDVAESAIPYTYTSIRPYIDCKRRQSERDPDKTVKLFYAMFMTALMLLYVFSFLEK